MTKIQKIPKECDPLVIAALHAHFLALRPGYIFRSCQDIILEITYDKYRAELRTHNTNLTIHCYVQQRNRTFGGDLSKEITWYCCGYVNIDLNDPTSTQQIEANVHGWLETPGAELNWVKTRYDP